MALPLEALPPEEQTIRIGDVGLTLPSGLVLARPQPVPSGKDLRKALRRVAVTPDCTIDLTAEQTEQLKPLIALLRKRNNFKAHAMGEADHMGVMLGQLSDYASKAAFNVFGPTAGVILAQAWLNARGTEAAERKEAGLPVTIGSGQAVPFLDPLLNELRDGDEPSFGHDSDYAMACITIMDALLRRLPDEGPLTEAAMMVQIALATLQMHLCQKEGPLAESV